MPTNLLTIGDTVYYIDTAQSFYSTTTASTTTNSTTTNWSGTGEYRANPWWANYTPVFATIPILYDTDFGPPYVPDEKELVRKAKAGAKAKSLLLSFLTRAQKKEFHEKEYVHIMSQSGKNYRIGKGRVRNVSLIEDGKIKRRYCIHPIENVPNEDNMLAQILMLQTQEEQFLKIANASAA